MSHLKAQGFETLCCVLIVLGARVDGKSRDRVPLYEASKYGHERICKVLIDRNCKVNLQNSQGQTPMHIAAMRGHKRIVQLLINNSAKINMVDV